MVNSNVILLVDARWLFKGNTLSPRTYAREALQMMSEKRGIIICGITHEQRDAISHWRMDTSSLCMDDVIDQCAEVGQKVECVGNPENRNVPLMPLVDWNPLYRALLQSRRFNMARANATANMGVL